jgi:hypothetical protein
MPRPKSDIDLEELEKLCAMQCTDEEIAAFLRVSTRTIERRRKVPSFREAMERGKAKGAFPCAGICFVWQPTEIWALIFF